jgi:hypothetical protein
MDVWKRGSKLVQHSTEWRHTLCSRIKSIHQAKDGGEGKTGSPRNLVVENTRQHSGCNRGSSLAGLTVSQRVHPHRSGQGEIRHNALGSSLRAPIPFYPCPRHCGQGKAVDGLAEPSPESSGVGNGERRVKTNAPIKFNLVPTNQNE